MRWESPSSPVGKYPKIAYWEPRPASSPPRPSHGQFPGRPQEPPLSVLTPALPWGRVEGATSAGRSALSSGAQASLDRKHPAHPFPSCSPLRRAGVGSAERGAPWRQEAAHTRPPGGSGLILPSPGPILPCSGSSPPPDPPGALACLADSSVSTDVAVPRDGPRDARGFPRLAPGAPLAQARPTVPNSGPGPP